MCYLAQAATRMGSNDRLVRTTASELANMTTQKSDPEVGGKQPDPEPGGKDPIDGG